MIKRFLSLMPSALSLLLVFSGLFLYVNGAMAAGQESSETALWITEFPTIHTIAVDLILIGSIVGVARATITRNKYKLESLVATVRRLEVTIARIEATCEARRENHGRDPDRRHQDE